MHPAALIPGRRVSDDLLRVARKLRLVRSDAGEGSVVTQLDGRQSIKFANEELAAQLYAAEFPLAMTGPVSLRLPPLLISFHDWWFLPTQIINGYPVTGDYWLRMVIQAEATQTDAISNNYPVEVTFFSGAPGVGPSFEWQNVADGTPEYEAGIPAGDPREYYFYLVRVTEGLIVDRPSSTFIYQQPPTLFI